MSLIVIDGSQGEGGGQVLRTALAYITLASSPGERTRPILWSWSRSRVLPPLALMMELISRG